LANSNPPRGTGYQTQKGSSSFERIPAGFTVTLHSTLKIKQENGRKGVILFEKLNSLSLFLLFDLGDAA
jgi:hypothetical protein